MSLHPLRYTFYDDFSYCQINDYAGRHTNCIHQISKGNENVFRMDDFMFQKYMFTIKVKIFLFN